MPLLLTLIALLLLILLIAWLKIDTFISFLIVSIALGLATGLDVPQITHAVQSGIGSTLGELILIVGFGALLGKLVAESGAAQQITDALVKLFGIKHIQWGLALAGFVIGIPLFYSAGFVIVVPLIFMISESVKLPILYVAIPMLSALSVAHGYLPPHPSPSAVALQLNADIGKTLLYGIIVSIPAIAIAGPVFGKTLKKYKPSPSKDLFEIKPMPKEQLPGLGISIATALLPVFLLTVMASVKGLYPENTAVQLLAEPYIGMLVAVLFATWALGLNRGKSMPQITKSFEDAFKGVSVILLIVAGAGVFKQMMTEGGVSTYIAEMLKDVQISPIILSWGMAAIIRVCVGSATVAGLTTVGILAPILQTADVSTELIVLAIGSGSLMFSHLNDGGFWIYKEYFNLSIKDTIMTWSVMETIVSVVGLLGVLLLSLVV